MLGVRVSLGPQFYPLISSNLCWRRVISRPMRMRAAASNSSCPIEAVLKVKGASAARAYGTLRLTGVINNTIIVITKTKRLLVVIYLKDVCLLINFQLSHLVVIFFILVLIIVISMTRIVIIVFVVITIIFGPILVIGSTSAILSLDLNHVRHLIFI